MRETTDMNYDDDTLLSKVSFENSDHVLISDNIIIKLHLAKDFSTTDYNAIKQYIRAKLSLISAVASSLIDAFGSAENFIFNQLPDFANNSHESDMSPRASTSPGSPGTYSSERNEKAVQTDNAKNILNMFVLPYCDIKTAGTLALCSRATLTLAMRERWLKNTLGFAGVFPSTRISLWRTLLKTDILAKETVLEFMCRAHNTQGQDMTNAHYQIKERIDVWLAKNGTFAKQNKIDTAKRKCCRNVADPKSFDAGCDHVLEFMREFQEVTNEWSQIGQAKYATATGHEAPFLKHSGIAQQHMGSRGRKRRISVDKTANVPDVINVSAVVYAPCEFCCKLKESQTDDSYTVPSDLMRSSSDDHESVECSIELLEEDSSSTSLSSVSNPNPKVQHDEHAKCTMHRKMCAHLSLSSIVIENYRCEPDGVQEPIKDYTSYTTQRTRMAGLGHSWDMPNPGANVPARFVRPGAAKDTTFHVPVQKSCSFQAGPNHPIKQDDRLPAHWTNAKVHDMLSQVTPVRESEDTIATNTEPHDHENWLGNKVPACTCCRCCYNEDDDDEDVPKTTENIPKLKRTCTYVEGMMPKTPDLFDKVTLADETKTTHEFNSYCSHFAMGIWASVGRWHLPTSFNSEFDQCGEHDGMISPYYWHCHHSDISLTVSDIATLKYIEVGNIDEQVLLRGFTGEDIFNYILDHAAIELAQSVKIEIRRDLDRTFPHSPAFANEDGVGQKYLEQVLIAIAVANPWVGYCQGLNFVAAAALLQCGCAVESFWIVMGILRHCDAHLLFGPNVPQLKGRLQDFSKLFMDACPRTSLAFDHSGLEVSFVVQQWMMTMFSYVIDPALLGHVWDVFFYSGWKAMHRCAISLILPLESHIWQNYNSKWRMNRTKGSHEPRIPVDPYDLMLPMQTFNFQFRCAVETKDFQRETMRDLDVEEIWDPLLVHKSDMTQFRKITASGINCMRTQMVTFFQTGNNIRINNHCLTDFWIERFHDDLCLAVVPEATKYRQRLSGSLMYYDPRGVAMKGAKQKSKKRFSGAYQPTPTGRNLSQPEYTQFDQLNVLKGMIVDPFLASENAFHEVPQNDLVEVALSKVPHFDNAEKLLVWIDMQPITMRNWPLQECPRAYLNETIKAIKSFDEIQTLLGSLKELEENSLVSSFLEDSGVGSTMIRDPDIVAFRRALNVHGHPKRAKIRTQGTLATQWHFVKTIKEQQEGKLRSSSSTIRLPMHTNPHSTPQIATPATKKWTSTISGLWKGRSQLQGVDTKPSAEVLTRLETAQNAEVLKSESVSMKALRSSSVRFTPSSLPLIVRRILRTRPYDSVPEKDQKEDSDVPEDTQCLSKSSFVHGGQRPTEYQRTRSLQLSPIQLRLLSSPTSIMGGTMSGRYFVVPLTALYDLYSRVEVLDVSWGVTNRKHRFRCDRFKREINRTITQLIIRSASITKLQQELKEMKEKKQRKEHHKTDEHASKTEAPLPFNVKWPKPKSPKGSTNDHATGASVFGNLGNLFNAKSTTFKQTPTANPTETSTTTSVGVAGIRKDVEKPTATPKTNPILKLMSQTTLLQGRDDTTESLKPKRDTGGWLVGWSARGADDKLDILETQIVKQIEAKKKLQEHLKQIRGKVSVLSIHWDKSYNVARLEKQELLRNFLVRVCWTFHVPHIDWSPIKYGMSSAEIGAIPEGTLPNLRNQLNLYAKAF